MSNPVPLSMLLNGCWGLGPVKELSQGRHLDSGEKKMLATINYNNGEIEEVIYTCAATTNDDNFLHCP